MLTPSPDAIAIQSADEQPVGRAAWVKPVIEDFNCQIEGGSIQGVSDASVFTS